nr:hypothetical protein [Tanacetum cinerariifolium]
MHNNIKAAGSRDCPPMLALERYAQWKSRFLRYIDTRPNGDALRTCILQGKKDYTYHKEKMLLCKQAEKGVSLQAEQANWLANTDEEIDKQELEEHYSYMEKIQKTDLETHKTLIDHTVDYEKLERKKDYTYHKEKMLLCKQAEKGVSLQAEQANWLANTDEEIDKQELEEYYSYMEKIQKVPTVESGTDTEPLEHVQYDAEYNVFANERQHSE